MLRVKGASLVVNSYFGDNTLAAVQKFQRDNGLDDDGIVGPKTWGMLLSSSSVYYGGSRSGGNNSRPAYEANEDNGNTDTDIIYTKDEAFKYINGGTWGLYNYGLDDFSKLPQVISYKEGEYIYVYALVQATTEFMGITMEVPNGYGYRCIYSDEPKRELCMILVTPSIDTFNGGLGSKTGYKFKNGVDLDYRGAGKTYGDALEEAFRKIGMPRSDFEVTKWAKDVNGKSFPVEWRASNGAEVNIDIGHTTNGPDVPHVGYQTCGKRGNGGAIREHILVDWVPINR